MDRDDFLQLFEGLPGDDQLAVQNGKSRKEWIGWAFLVVAIALVSFAVIALIYALIHF